MYAYCFNNPVNDIDANGTWSWKNFFKGLGKVLLGAAIVGFVAVGTALTAGGLAAVLGASTVLINGVIAAGAIGGLTFGGMSILTQGITNGFDNLNLGTVAIDTFTGAAFSSLGVVGMGASFSTKTLVGLGMTGISGISAILNGINEGDSFDKIYNNTKQSMALTLVYQTIILGFSAFSSNKVSKNLFKRFIIGVNNTPILKSFLTQLFKGFTKLFK